MWTSIVLCLCLAAMKFIPPLKPHFFKPILPGFENGIRIPTSFLSKYILSPEETCPEEALLKKNGQEWRVDVIKEHFTGDGWRRFAEENGLESQDWVVCEYQGNMVFHAMIFDPITHCGQDDQEEVETTETGFEVKKEVLSDLDEEDQEKVETGAGFEVKKEVLSDFDEEEEVPDASVLNMPNYFISTIKPSNIKWCFLGIPPKFARSSGLANRNCEITVKDGKGKSWFMNLTSAKDSQTRIRHTSKVNEFFSANGFKEGDSFKFEVLSSGNGDESPVVRITTPDHVETLEVGNRDCKRRRASTEVNVPESESENGGYPYFTSKITKHSTRNQCLNIPLKFARANGLFGKGKMILMNKRGRRWGVHLRPDSSHFRIVNGWKDFRDDNAIKEGDAFKFETVKNGAVPVVRFTVED